jgi:hypothetical protein
MISGAHVIIYSKDADADRLFFDEILGFNSVDAGRGWLIFALPPAEVAFHPNDTNNKHELWFMCKDIVEEVKSLKLKGVPCTDVKDEPWGMLTMITLPSGGEIGIYQPKHPTAVVM